MRPLGWLGVLLVIAGVVVLAMGGVSYTKERDAVSVGPIEIAAEKKGVVPPAVGWAALAAGALLVFVGRRRA
jgi:hypothetical protein